MKSFLDFIREQGVVGLAIGFILGGAVSDLVKSFIANLVNPALGIILGRVDGLKDATFTIVGASFGWGNFITVLINFIVIALVVFVGFKLLGLEHLDKKKS